jgi:hypothetical protein
MANLAFRGYANNRLFELAGRISDAVLETGARGCGTVLIVLRRSRFSLRGTGCGAESFLRGRTGSYWLEAAAPSPLLGQPAQIPKPLPLAWMKPHVLTRWPARASLMIDGENATSVTE